MKKSLKELVLKGQESLLEKKIRIYTHLWPYVVLKYPQKGYLGSLFNLLENVRF